MDRPEWSLERSGAFDGDFARLREKLTGWGGLEGCAILLTGATGFFGLWLLELFDWLRRSEGLDVTAHVLSRDPESVLARHPVYRRRPWMRFLKGDVRDFEPPGGRLDYILHGATGTSAQAGRNAAELFDVIYAGARHVLGLAGAAGARRVLLVSSGAVYGPTASPGKIAETCMTAPDTMRLASAYGEGKRVCEALGTYLVDGSAFEVVSARCFAFLGAGLPLSGHFAIGNFIRDALENCDLHLNSTGKSQRSYLYGADLAVWLMTLLLNGRAGAAYNVGSDRELDVLSAARRVRDTLKPELSVRIAENASTAASFYVPDIERARSELGLDVWTDLELAIRRTAQDALSFGPLRRQT